MAVWKRKEKKFVHDFLVQQITIAKVKEYYTLFEDFAGPSDQSPDLTQNDEIKLTSVLDSVKILAICKKINKTLNQTQKMVVLLRLFELVNSDKKFTDQRMDIITTVADVFKIPKSEINDIEYFVTGTSLPELIDKNILIINDNGKTLLNSRYVPTEKLDGDIIILSIPSVGLYFMKYTGNEDIFLNGLIVSNRRIYLLANGSAIRLPKRKTCLITVTSSLIFFWIKH